MLGEKKTKPQYKSWGGVAILSLANLVWPLTAVVIFNDFVRNEQDDKTWLDPLLSGDWLAFKILFNDDEKGESWFYARKSWWITGTAHSDNTRSDRNLCGARSNSIIVHRIGWDPFQSWPWFVTPTGDSNCLT